MDIFGTFHRWGGGGGWIKKLSLPWNLPHMSYNDETWHSYNLPKEEPKIYELRDTNP